MIKVFNGYQCPICKALSIMGRRIPRKLWMRALPKSCNYRCDECGSEFLVILYFITVVHSKSLSGASPFPIKLCQGSLKSSEVKLSHSEGHCEKESIQRREVIGILQHQEAGIKVGEIVREQGMSKQTIYNLKAKYGSMTASEERRIKSLEMENQQLKILVAEQALSNQALREVVGIKSYALPGKGRLARP